MNVEKINKSLHKPRILVAPLDWGLGHATRCIPIINFLLQHEITVIIAAEGAVAKLLKQECGDCIFIPIEGYNIRLHSRPASSFFQLLWQVPRALKTMIYEKKWLDKAIILHDIDGVISDNRYGLNNRTRPAVLITHQLQIRSGSRFLDKLAQVMNYRFINRFDECWVPDLQGQENLAGELSHPKKPPAIPLKYLGVLSRFQKKSNEKDIDLLVVLSGPEPQRSEFEAILKEQVEAAKGKMLFIRGIPGNTGTLKFGNPSVKQFNHLPSKELNQAFLRSKKIVCRSGYSTIMDLYATGQTAILIPTPGQGEQEFLAKYLSEKKWFLSYPQKNFNLQHALQKADNAPRMMNEDHEPRFEKIVLEWLQWVKQKKEIRNHGD